MNMVKKIMLPSIVAVAGFAGVSGATLVSNLTANADTASGTTSTAATTSSDTSSTSSTASDTKTAPDPSKGGHVANGITETVLTGDTATKAEDAAKAAVPGATVERAETDAEGAAYEVHMKKSDGSMVTVKLDSSFKVTSSEDGMR